MVSLCRVWSLGVARKASIIMTAKMSSAVDVQLAVPWGHIAGKAWGDPAGKRVLALHGWLDNAGSFDKLIPMLSPDLHIVAIDWPGHGKSSHRPKGTRYNSFDYVADIKYVIDALKWDKFTLMAHSLGTGAASWFAGSLPDMVETLVCFEGIGFFFHPATDIPNLMGKALEELSALDNKEHKIMSTWDVVVDRVLEAHQQSQKNFSREAAATLAVRGTDQLENGEYYFTRDLRLKERSLLRVTRDVNGAFLSSIQCPILLITAEESYLPPSLFDILMALLPSKKLTRISVPGGHHVHLENPERVHTVVNEFLLKDDNTLSGGTSDS